MQGDDPPFLSVGTEVSAKYKGAFCEAKVRKVVKSIKCKVSGLSSHCEIATDGLNLCCLIGHVQIGPWKRCGF
jgi:hypothetical protein